MDSIYTLGTIQLRVRLIILVALLLILLVVFSGCARDYDSIDINRQVHACRAQDGWPDIDRTGDNGYTVVHCWDTRP